MVKDITEPNNIVSTKNKTKNESKGHGCPHLKNLNANCLCQTQTKTDRWTDRGNTIYPFHHSSNDRGIKRKKNKTVLFKYRQRNNTKPAPSENTPQSLYNTIAVIQSKNNVS